MMALPDLPSVSLGAWPCTDQYRSFFSLLFLAFSSLSLLSEFSFTSKAQLNCHLAFLVLGYTPLLLYDVWCLCCFSPSLALVCNSGVDPCSDWLHCRCHSRWNVQKFSVRIWIVICTLSISWLHVADTCFFHGVVFGNFLQFKYLSCC